MRYIALHTGNEFRKYQLFVFLNITDLTAKHGKIYTVSQKMHQLWNGMAQNCRDRFWWFLV